MEENSRNQQQDLQHCQQAISKGSLQADHCTTFKTFCMCQSCLVSECLCMLIGHLVLSSLPEMLTSEQLNTAKSIEQLSSESIRQQLNALRICSSVSITACAHHITDLSVVWTGSHCLKHSEP